VVEYLHGSYRVSERRACRVTRLNRGTYRYRAHRDPRTALRMRIREIAQTRVRYGYRKIRVLLNREGWKVGKYLVKRLYREEGLTLHRRRKRRRRVAEHRRERFHPTGPNQAWSMDFLADQLADGRRFRSPTVVDIYTRECLAIESAQRLKGEDVVLALNRIKIQRGVPKFLYCDNGSEISSQAMDLWAYRNGVRMAFSRPGKPTNNAIVESFNGTFRAEGLNTHWFTSLTETQQIVETWRREYNESRPYRLWGRRRPTNSPMKSRLAAISLGCKQPETHPRVGTKRRADQAM
jgi:putative transposase